MRKTALIAALCGLAACATGLDHQTAPVPPGADGSPRPDTPLGHDLIHARLDSAAAWLDTTAGKLDATYSDGDATRTPVEYTIGPERTHYVDGNLDGVFEKEVCVGLKYDWEDDTHLKIRARSFGLTYAEGETPCEDIQPHERWMSRFKGFLRVSTADGQNPSKPIDFAADVNDGVRLVIWNQTRGAEICRIQLWKDVPQYDDYHSTSSYNIDRGCKTALVAGAYYPMRLDVYHQSDGKSPNVRFNRAFLQLFYNNLPVGADVKFFRRSK